MSDKQPFVVELPDLYTCPRCHGTGVVEEYQLRGDDTSGFSTVCPDCNGEGIIEVFVETELEMPPEGYEVE